MKEYIERYSVLKEYYRQHKGQPGGAEKIIRYFPAADVVPRSWFTRLLEENYTARKMLEQIGKKPGDSMDDVRLVVRSSWRHNEGDNIPYCDNCGMPQDIPSDFCLSCGADMREEQE